MNGPGTRGAFSAGVAEGAPPAGLVIGDPIPESDDFGARIVPHRSWSGRVCQMSYAVIDVLLVCLGRAVALLRFGVPNPFDFEVVSLRRLSLRASTHGYPGFLLLYCALIVLGCISQHLYRTPREITSFT